MNYSSERKVNLVLFILAGTGILFFLLPVLSLLFRMPWGSVGEVFGNPEIWDAFRISLIVSLSAVVLSLVFGFPIAWIITRYPSRWTRIVRVIVLVPMVLPPIVGGVALLSVFGANSPIGHMLISVGIQLPFSTLGAVLAVTFVSGPFMIIMLESGMHSLDDRLEHAAEVLGASRWMIIRTIILPGLRPALIGGAALTWARALGEFGATIAFAGNRPGHTQTLPLAIYQALQSDMDRALLISAELILITVCLMIFVRSRGIGHQ
ncbi:MAG: molybdate ABC transporter permease subunit [Phycisphaerales bacterium]|nr:molybdate ABC transporter permease subunit [Phycisphaerales bacterium]